MQHVLQIVCLHVVSTRLFPLSCAHGHRDNEKVEVTHQSPNFFSRHGGLDLVFCQVHL